MISLDSPTVHRCPPRSSGHAQSGTWGSDPGKPSLCNVLTPMIHMNMKPLYIYKRPLRQFRGGQGGQVSLTTQSMDTLYFFMTWTMSLWATQSSWGCKLHKGYSRRANMIQLAICILRMFNWDEALLHVQCLLGRGTVGLWAQHCVTQAPCTQDNFFSVKHLHALL